MKSGALMGGALAAAAASVLAGPAFAAPLAMAISGDTVLGGKCIQSNQFKHADLIDFRAHVVDTKTGEDMTGDDLTSVVAELPDGSSFPLAYGEHPPQNPQQSYWTVAWPVPADYPTGTLSYKIVATNKAGETATFEPFKIMPSQLTITDE
jgi:hypothetical protein